MLLGKDFISDKAVYIQTVLMLSHKFVYTFIHFPFFSNLMFIFLHFFARKTYATCSKFSVKGKAVLVCESDAACFQ